MARPPNIDLASFMSARITTRSSQQLPHHLRGWIAAILPLLLASCALQEKGPHLDPLAAINPAQKFNPFAPQSPLAASVVTQWEKDFAKPGFLQPNDYWHTRKGRDELTYRLILMSDYRFSRYEADLVAGKATRDSFIDLAVLGLTSAATLMEPGQATRVLAAISGGLIGSRATIEKHFYQNQAQPVLLRKMRVLRQQKLFAISHRLRKYDVAVYPTERALIDVLDYYNRGTMLSALQEISNETAAQEIELRGGKVSRPPAEGQDPRLDAIPTAETHRAPTEEITQKKPPEPAPALLSEHERRKALIKGLANLSEVRAISLLGKFAPAGFDTSGDARVRLQVLISQTGDPKLSEMEMEMSH